MHPTPWICDRMLGLNMDTAELGTLRQELTEQVLVLKQQQLENLASNNNNVIAMLPLKKIVKGSSPDQGSVFFFFYLHPCLTEKVSLALPYLVLWQVYTV